MSGSDQVHLVVLLHGLYGSRGNLWCLEEEIASAAAAGAEEKADPNELEVVVLVPTCYEGSRTWDGIDVNAHRVADDVYAEIDRLESASKRVVAFSVTGYSLGGLIGRYLLGLIHTDRPHFLPSTATSFSTFATPHLGVLAYKTTTSVLVHSLGRRLFSRTGQQIYLLDRWIEGEGEGEDEGEDGGESEGQKEGKGWGWWSARKGKGKGKGRPLLQVLADPNDRYHTALGLFPSIRIFGNGCHDLTVPFPTAMITSSDPFASFETRGVQVVTGEGGIVVSWTERRRSKIGEVVDEDQVEIELPQGQVREGDGEEGEEGKEVGRRGSVVSIGRRGSVGVQGEEIVVDGLGGLGEGIGSSIEAVGEAGSTAWTVAVNWIWPRSIPARTEGRREIRDAQVSNSSTSTSTSMSTGTDSQPRSGSNSIRRRHTPASVSVDDKYRLGKTKDQQMAKFKEKLTQKRPTIPPIFILPYPWPFKYMLLPLVPIIVPIFFSIVMVVFTIHSYQSLRRIQTHQTLRRLKLASLSLATTSTPTIPSLVDASSPPSISLHPESSDINDQSPPLTATSITASTTSTIASTSTSKSTTLLTPLSPTFTTAPSPTPTPKSSILKRISSETSTITPSRSSTPPLIPPSLFPSHLDPISPSIPPSPLSSSPSVSAPWAHSSSPSFTNPFSPSSPATLTSPPTLASPTLPNPASETEALHTLTLTQLDIIDHFTPNYLPQLERIIAWFPYHFNTHGTIIARAARPTAGGQGKNKDKVKALEVKVNDGQTESQKGKINVKGKGKMGLEVDTNVRKGREGTETVAGGRFAFQAAGRGVVKVWAQAVVRDGQRKIGKELVSQ